MNTIKIIDKVPIILTKDGNWLNVWGKDVKMTSGSIVLLPQDAVLVLPPIKLSVDVAKTIED